MVVDSSDLESSEKIVTPSDEATVATANDNTGCRNYSLAHRRFPLTQTRDGNVAVDMESVGSVTGWRSSPKSSSHHCPLRSVGVEASDESDSDAPFVPGRRARNRPSGTRVHLENACRPPSQRSRCSSSSLDGPRGFRPRKQLRSRVSSEASRISASTLRDNHEKWPIRAFLVSTRSESQVTLSLELPAQSFPVETFEPPPPSPSVGGKQRTPSRLGTKALNRRARFKPTEDKLLIELKDQNCSWKEIGEYFPHRTIGALQVRYSTRLNYKRTEN